ncbi:MAG TPA: multicopper oxidase family protein [Ktedonobacteraceae bacterium]|nr:multicopper oxidase family protein [Ktedonobacteraceae bacterium]
MEQIPIKNPKQTLKPTSEDEPEGSGRRKIFVISLLLLAVLLITGGIISLNFGKKSSVPSTASDSSAVPSFLPAPQIPAGQGVPTSVNMGMPGAPTSITTLKAPLTAAHMDQFTLVAQNSILTLTPDVKIAAWTFNGASPASLVVHQGYLVVVTVVNHLSFGITIHWHGINSFNSADGVAGVTQDAIAPGQSYVYRFIPPQAGTFWFHAHQLASDETAGGLFGKLLVLPSTPPSLHVDVDEMVALHLWNGPNNQELFSIDDALQTLNKAAKPGQWVRLRVIETSNTDSSIPHLITLLGAPFQVITLDGQDLYGPQWLNTVPVPLGTAQRVDLLFQMPAHGSVSLITANDQDNNQVYQRFPNIVFGQGSAPTTLPAVTNWFDLTTYGQPASTPITLQSHFNVNETIDLNNQMGTSLGRQGMTYTINGKVFPDTGMIMVKYGQLVKVRLVNQSDLYHPIHLHGHVFTVLDVNGKPLTGSPVRLDTVLVHPHTTVEIGFLANNPGIWMIHCHNFQHANWGMDMMLDYYGYSTPYTVGTAKGNFPD